MKLRIDKTSRRVGVHTLPINIKPPKVKQIGTTLGPIRVPKVTKLKLPQYGV